MERSGSELVIECLKAEGVRHIFGVSGTSTLPILDVIYHNPQIRYIQSQHEQGAMFMANGYARATKKASICLVHHGVGATNCFTAMTHAHYNSTPSILIAPEEAQRSYLYGASPNHNLEGSTVYKPITKLSIRVERTDLIPKAFQKAFRAALTGRPGPVYVGLPINVLSGRAEVEIIPPQYYRTEVRMPGVPVDISRAADLLMKAKSPVILAGAGAAFSGAQEALKELAELLSIPVGASEGNNGIIPEDHPLALGIIGAHSIPLAIKTFQRADVLLAIGCNFGDRTTDHFTHRVIPEGAKIIHIDIDPEEIGKIYPVEMGIVGDARCVVEGLIHELKERGSSSSALEVSPRVRELIRMKKEWEDSTLPLRTSNKIPIQRFRLMHDLRKALPRDAIVSGQSGSNHAWFDHAFPAYVPATVSGGWHSLGSEYPESLGVKVALPERMVVCVTGDGSIMMSLQELATAVANKIPILCVVSHNDLFGNMHHTQIRNFGSRFIGTNLYVPNLGNIAREFGAYGERVERPEEIIPAVKRALNSGKHALLDVIIDKSVENLNPPQSIGAEAGVHTE